MPHIIVEHSQNLAGDQDIESLCQEIFDMMAAHPTFPNPSAIKVRALGYNHRVQALENDHFVHATIKLLPGRDDETKKQLSQNLLDLLMERLGNASSFSVDVEDLSSAYVKAAR
ncbi:5-carboxymethyl-2-hydroxymuconate Delta-isomerase [Maritalea sp. S77]|jgi:5-carboxymethyl-2-hydroxymuconate isomerase|uniref:5-carboxymethyl-2-hydroxymuconate Delta-isomerase n=1 Tax=Maritalea sp. S77 TaxID=3415125 RepID=UPI003C7E9606